MCFLKLLQDLKSSLLHCLRFTQKSSRTGIKHYLHVRSFQKQMIVIFFQHVHWLNGAKADTHWSTQACALETICVERLGGRLISLMVFLIHYALPIFFTPDQPALTHLLPYGTLVVFRGEIRHTASQPLLVNTSIMCLRFESYCTCENYCL